MDFEAPETPIGGACARGPDGRPDGGLDFDNDNSGAELLARAAFQSE